MPLLNVSTSQNISEKEIFLNKSSKFISSLLNKSEDFVMVKLNDSLPMQFAGTNQPSCFIEIKSIGSLNPSQMSEQICDFFSEAIGVNPERIYINFVDINSSMWGWNNRTFG